MVNGAILLFAYGLMCWLVGRRLPLITVHYVFPEEPFARTRAVLSGADAVRTAAHGNPLRCRLLDLPIMPDEGRLRRFLASMPSALLVRYRDDSSMAERVRGILRRNLKRPVVVRGHRKHAGGVTADVAAPAPRRGNCGFQEIKDGLGATLQLTFFRSPGCRSKRSGSPWGSRNPALSIGRSDGGPASPPANSAIAHHARAK